MALQTELKTDARTLLGKSGELKSIRSSLGNTMELLDSKIRSLPGFWEGEASETYQNRFNKFRKEIEDALKNVDDYSDSLDEIAMSYISAEQKARGSSDALPTDIFVI